MKSLFLMFAVLLANIVYAEDQENVSHSKSDASSLAIDETNTLVINLPITHSTMRPLYTFLIDKISKKSLPPNMTIILDSPGGEVSAGFRFIALMHAAQQSGTKFNCIVTNMAASMAFHILTQCDTRVTLDGAMLLWHRARVQLIQETLTTISATSLGEELSVLDDIILKALTDSLSKDLSKEQIAYHFNLETIHMGVDLGAKAPHFIKSMPYIKGLIEAANNNNIVHTVMPPTQGMFEFKIKNTFVYIYESSREEFIKLLN